MELEREMRGSTSGDLGLCAPSLESLGGGRRPTFEPRLAGGGWVEGRTGNSSTGGGVRGLELGVMLELGARDLNLQRLLRRLRRRAVPPQPFRLRREGLPLGFRRTRARLGGGEVGETARWRWPLRGR